MKKMSTYYAGEYDVIVIGAGTAEEPGDYVEDETKKELEILIPEIATGETYSYQYEVKANVKDCPEEISIESYEARTPSDHFPVKVELEY